MSIIKENREEDPLGHQVLGNQEAYVRIRNHKNDASTSDDCQGGSYKTVTASLVGFVPDLQNLVGLRLVIQQEC